ncbi:hypothetical protein [Neptuniibacter halophilus]|uniref:hypothetical protein n=1 Tax=Neptuniibacter halophilus TaxID=651666 RepID=UPI0025740D52|nr:hypothetical protein [Neptuniibacter halophilus]
MENACNLCYNLVLHYQPHSELKKISELRDSELYKCCCCNAYLHKQRGEWEIISAGEFCGTPEQREQKIRNDSEPCSNGEQHLYPLSQQAS